MTTTPQPEKGLSVTQDANDLLMSGGIKAAKFDTLGTTVVGTIVDEPKAQQMTKFQSDELDYWPSGDPKLQIVVTLQTDQRTDQEDDGRRRLFIIPRMMPPVREAVKATGAKGLAVGGRIAVKWVSGSGQGEGNAKQYAAEYAAPAIDPGGLLNTPATPPPASAPPTVAAPATPQGGMLSTSPTTTGPAPQQHGSLLSGQSAPVTAPPPPGVDPNVWAGLPDQQKQAILAAYGLPANPTPQGGQQFPY